MKRPLKNLLIFGVLFGLSCFPAFRVSAHDSNTDLISIPLAIENWDVVYSGYGPPVVFNNEGMLFQPVAPTATRPTSAALILSQASEQCPLQNFRLKVTATTKQQLRATNPNAWEVFWIVTNYQPQPNNTKTMNYFIMKPASPWQAFPGGVELGYAYDDVGQTFLATPLVPILTINQPNTFEIVKQGLRYQVWVDGQLSVDYTDSGLLPNGLSNLPGAIGAYTEDARVNVSSFEIQPLPPYDPSCYSSSANQPNH